MSFVSVLLSVGRGSLDQLLIQQMMLGAMASLPFSLNGFRSERECWWLLKSSPIDPRSLFKAKLLTSTAVCGLYASLFSSAGMAVGDVSPWRWAAGLAGIWIYSSTVSAVNCMIGSLLQPVEEGRGVSGELGLVVAIASSIALLLILLLPPLWLAGRPKWLLLLGGAGAAVLLLGIQWAAVRAGIANTEKLISS